MALNVQNKNFLALLNKLDIDISRFNDKTFDGLFYNTPDDINYFLNWFMENITPDNALTQLEQAMYFELEKTNSLPSEEEVEKVLSTCDFTYEELNSLDINYVNSLAEQLEDFKSDMKELNDLSSSLESCHSDIKKRSNNLKEELNIWKKQLHTAKNKFSNTDLLFGEKLDEAHTFLLEEAIENLDLTTFNNLSMYEKEVFNKLYSCKLLENDNSMSEYVTLLPKLEEDLACVESYLIYSQSSLKEKEARIAVLSESLQKSSQQKSICDSTNYSIIQCQFNEYDDISSKVTKDLRSLEIEIHKKTKRLSRYEMQKILSQYLFNKIDIKNVYISKFTTIQNYIKGNQLIDSLLLEILCDNVVFLQNTLQTRKELCSKLNEIERKSSNDISNFEMRKQRFNEISLKTNQHPFVIALRQIFRIEDNLENNEVTLNKIAEFLSQKNESVNLNSHKFRMDLKSKVKRLLDNELCGPTSQLLFVPVELTSEYHKCEKYEAELSRKIKHLANKYVETKEYISKSDRKKLLSWIKLLTHSEDVPEKIHN